MPEPTLDEMLANVRTAINDALIAGGATLDAAVDHILAAFPTRPHVFNLGHGIQQDTPIAHVEALIARVRGGRG